MSLFNNLDAAHNAAQRISQGINALELMTTALDYEHDPYADGFNALYDYLSDAAEELCKHLDACMETV